MTLSKNAKLFLVLQFFFSFATGLSAMFVNVFLWKLNSSLTALAQFNLMQSFIILVSFPLCAVVARRAGPIFSLQLGIVFFVAGYGLLLYFQNESANQLMLIGFVLGWAVSFFAVGMHIVSMDHTHNENRDRFFAIGGVLGSIGGIVTPLLSGWLIVHFAGMNGYYIVFALSVALFVVAVLLSIRINQQRISSKSFMKEVLFYPTPVWRRMMWGTFFSGMKEGVYASFLVTLVTYFILKDELSLGWFTTLFSIVGMLSSWWFAKRIHHRNRRLMYFLGGLGIAAVSVGLAIWPIFGMLVVFGIVTSISQNAVGIPFISMTYEAIEADPSYREKRLDYIIAREIPLGAGRMLSLGCFIWIGQSLSDASILSITLAVLGCFHLFVLPFMPGGKKEIAAQSFSKPC